MSNCKQCLHSEACNRWISTSKIAKYFPKGNCVRFLNKEQVIVLPCPVATKLYGVRYHKSTDCTMKYEFIAPDIGWLIEHSKEIGKTIFTSPEAADKAIEDGYKGEG